MVVVAGFQVEVRGRVLGGLRLERVGLAVHIIWVGLGGND